MSCGVAGAVVEVRRAPGDSARVNSSGGNYDARSPFPPEMLGQARATPDGWLYAVDPALAPHGPEGVVPPEAIKGVWKVAGIGPAPDAGLVSIGLWGGDHG